MSALTVSAVAAAGEIARADWEQLAPAGHPFLNRNFLDILERHGMAGLECGWTARHLIARDGAGKALGILPLYARTNSHGDFLASFNAERRRKLRAERRRVADSGLAIEVRHGGAIDPAEWPALHHLYAVTFAKYGNFAAFTPAGFADLASALGRRMVVFIARERGDPVAISICFRSDDTLYGRYWGTAANHHSLHFELCFYQGIDYCLREGLATFEPGAGGEHKVARGFEPTMVRCCHWLADARIRRLLGQHLDRQRPAILAYAAEAAAHLPFRKVSGAWSPESGAT